MAKYTHWLWSPLGYREADLLWGAGIYTPDDLAQYCVEDLLFIPGLGRRTMERIELAAKKNGWAFHSKAGEWRLEERERRQKRLTEYVRRRKSAEICHACGGEDNRKRRALREYMLKHTEHPEHWKWASLEQGAAGNDLVLDGDPFDLSVRTSNVLAAAGIVTVGDLRKLGAAGFFSLRGGGRRCWRELKTAIAEAGLVSIE